MGLVDQYLGLAVGQPWQRNPQLDLEAESLRDGADPDGALDPVLRRNRKGVARCDILHSTQEAGGVPGGKQLEFIPLSFWYDAPLISPEFIPINSLPPMDSSAPGSYAGHSRVPSRDHGPLASTGGSGPSRYDNA